MARLATHVRRIPTVGVTTPRTSLDVLSREMPFTQSPILEPSDFVREAGRRGVRFRESLLEDLHRHKLLVPFYWAHPEKSRAKDVVDMSNSRVAALGNSGIMPRLIVPAARGEVSDPEHCRFRTWQRSREKQVDPDPHPGIYYSRHQLLLLPHIRWYIENHRTYFIGKGAKNIRSFERLDPTHMPDDGFEAACSEWRSLAVILSTLDTMVLPELFERISWPDQWLEMRGSFDAEAALQWLGLSLSDARQLVDRLLWDANGLDEIGDLYDLVRRAAPDTWDGLSGRTLMAHDLRIAAEIVARTVEMAEDIVVANDRDGVPVGTQRLSTRSRNLEELLTTNGLSPHPSLVVIVEGKTEHRLLPRVMETLGHPPRPDRTRIENREGLDEPIHLLARYAARPVLGNGFDRWVFLVRPPTRVLVLVDPEKDYSDEAKRERERQKIARSIVKELPAEVHADLLAAGTELVTVVAWPDGPFEFSHFSDDELADGLLRMSIVDYPGGRDVLVERIREERKKPHATRNRPGPDVAAVWKEWIVDYDFSKTKFADEMWPVLEAKVHLAMTTGSEYPPIVEAVNTAYRLARLPRKRVIVERSTDARANTDVGSAGFDEGSSNGHAGSAR